MTSKQRLAFLILQLNYGYTSWSGVLRLARQAALGSRSPEALSAASAVRSSLQAAEAAIATVGASAVRVGTEQRELVLA
jgi:hypothetical protein